MANTRQKKQTDFKLSWKTFNFLLLGNHCFFSIRMITEVAGFNSFELAYEPGGVIRYIFFECTEKKWAKSVTFDYHKLNLNVFLYTQDRAKE